MYYRVEDKYIVYEDQIAYLRSRLSEIMERDVHTRDKSYLVRSVYFDDLRDNAVFENESGVDDRTKFRIRSYNADDSYIMLEEKRKKNGYTHKKSARISKEAVTGLINNPSVTQAPRASEYLKGEDGFLFRRLYANMLTSLMHPVTIVEYEREAFVDRNGNVRITFDRNIGASDLVGRFFEKDIYAVPTMEKGAHVLEVKYDEFLPDYIRKMVDFGSLQKCAFSKYYYARTIKEGNGDYL